MNEDHPNDTNDTNDTNDISNDPCIQKAGCKEFLLLIIFLISCEVVLFLLGVPVTEF